MLPHYAARVSEIAPFHVMEVLNAARALEAQGRDMIHLEIGEPDFPTPGPVLVAAREALVGGDIHYTPALGLPELREAIAAHYRRQFGVTISPARIAVTAGSSAALLLACALLLGRDDELLVTDPGYPCNRQFIRLMEARAVGVPVGPETAYQLTAGLVDEYWGDRTKGVLLATPSNPTGTLLAPPELAGIDALVAGKGGCLLVDEIYQGLVYDAPPATVLSFSDRAFVINSFSKYFNMTGWRLGWLVVPDGAEREVEKLAQNLYICPSTIAQKAALACFHHETLNLLEQRRIEFARRRDFFHPALLALGFKLPVKPGGGFYLYADSSSLAADSQSFCVEMLQQTGVAFTPGADFGAFRAAEHVRFAYANSLERLTEAAERLQQALQPRQ